MGKYRALLIGASDYEMRGVSELPFIPGDLDRLGSALRSGGFDDVQVLAKRAGGKQLSANFIDARVTGFLRRARPNDTLFIFLSGHGVHAKGRDYLVPEDIDEDTHPFESGCVAIDWSEHLDETPARHVVFLIDACREGIEQEAMGVASVRQWSQQKVAAALRRKVARVYACKPAQLALFVRPRDTLFDPVPGIGPGESFSLFSRSVFDVISTHPGDAALTLSHFMSAVQERVEQLHRAYRKKGPPQTLWVDTDIAQNDFALLPPPRPLLPRSGLPSSQSAGTAAGMHGIATMGVGAAAPTRHAYGTLPSSPRGISQADRRSSPPPAGASAASANGRHSSKRLRKELKRSNRNLDRAMRGLRPTRFRAGRAAILAAGVALIGTTGYALWLSWPGQGLDKPSKSPTPGQTGSQRPTGTQSPPIPELGGQAVNSASVMSLPACTETDSLTPVTLTGIDSDRNYYDGTQVPTLTIKLKSITACRVSATPKQVRLTITSAGEDNTLWYSGTCVDKTPERWIAVSPTTPATVTYRWNRYSNTSCSTPEMAPAGTYLATGSFASQFVPDVQTSFVLSPT